MQHYQLILGCLIVCMYGCRTKAAHVIAMFVPMHVTIQILFLLITCLGSRAKKAPLQVKTGRMRRCKTSAVTDTTRVPLNLSYTGIQLTFILPPLSLSLPPSLPPPFPSKVHAAALQLMYLL